MHIKVSWDRAHIIRYMKWCSPVVWLVNFIYLGVRSRVLVSKLEMAAVGKSISGVNSPFTSARKTAKDTNCNLQGSLQAAAPRVCCPSKHRSWFSSQIRLVVRTPEGCRSGLLQHPWQNGRCCSRQGRIR